MKEKSVLLYPESFTDSEYAAFGPRLPKTLIETQVLNLPGP